MHDTEELAPLPRWLRHDLPALRDRFPAVPEAVWRRVESIAGREFTVAVGVMAAVAVASAAGHATGEATGVPNPGF
ncbi:HXXEE domain-containing protein [Streptomyces sp. NPDC018610]|uniref:HXXEE domain-containing protein n=1 Tax=Streptomyces sp. NPDC018610 TaxID=3365049 RepID=UPI0037965A24